MASSVAFPAFERAQQEHMSYDHSSAQNLYDSIAQTVQDPIPQSVNPQPIPPPLPSSSSLQARAQSQILPPTSSSLDLTKAQDAAPPRHSPSKPKITKRTNARLQLAAALIEADNDRIIQKAQVWHIYHPDQGRDAPRPPPPPEPALASQSAIFAPFRQDAPPSLTRHVRTWSAATGLSQLLGPRNDGSRPSIDFLGVALPNEKRSRSRATSSVGLGGDRHSRTDSLLSSGGTSMSARPSLTMSRSESLLSGNALTKADDAVDADDDALSAWGVDKFLSKEAKERIASGQRSGAESLAAVASKRFSLHQDDSAADARPIFESRRSLDLDRAGSVALSIPSKAKSDIVASASSPADLGKQDPKLELLAKIKLYRERHENLPPSLWDGPGPTATKDEVADHILAASNAPLAERGANGGDSQHDKRESAIKQKDLRSKGHTKAAASSSSTSILDRPRPFSRNDSISSSNLVGTPSQTDNRELAATTASISDPTQLYQQAGAATDSDVDFFAADLAKTLKKNAYSIATPDQLDHGSSSQLHPQAQLTPSALGYHTEAQISDIAVDKFDENGELLTMAGIGSYSRSQSRRNSMLGASLPTSNGDAGGAALTSPKLRPQSFLAGQQLQYQPSVGSPLAIPETGNLSARMSRVLQDPFSEHDLGLGPSPFAAALRAADLVAAEPSSRRGSAADLPPSQSFDTHCLTTKQLQTIARNSTFPSHLGINRDLLDDTIDEDFEEENEFGKLLRPSKTSLDAASLSEDIARTGGDNFEIRLGGGAAPDLSSANWGKPRKKWFRLSTMADAKGKVKKPKKTAAREDTDLDGESDADVLQDAKLAAVQHDEIRADQTRDPLESYAAEPAAKTREAGIEDTTQMGELGHNGAEDGLEIDDDYISPPRKGPLRPLGLSTRLPQTLVMPPPLQGTDLAPKTRLTETADYAVDRTAAAAKRHSLHVPDGFVLHDSRGDLPPMRSIVVHSANGPRPMFAAKPSSKKHERAITELKAIEVGRTVQVPAAAPRGIGRRAALPTTALFRNQLVQHDDEREGWGWEMGSRADDTFDPNAEGDSDDDDKPLADIKKNSRSAKKAAKKLAKLKRKRKAARRVRRAKREDAVREGKTFEEVGVDELSPDEDLDLSSTTSEEDATDSETDSDFWASDDDKRWVDDVKPAGKLYGKSLLDIAAERNTERKSKARFYGQVQLDGDTPGPLVKIGDDNGVSKTNLTVPAHDVADDAASVAPSVAKSFRDKPLGYNDTRERMEAVFGADKVWEREMARRKEEEAREAEEQKARMEAEALEAAILAQKKAKKEKAFFSLGKNSGKNKKDTLGIKESMAGSSVSLGGSHSGERTSNVGVQEQNAVDGVAPEEEDGDEPVRSHTPVAPPVLAVDVVEDVGEAATQGGRRSFALLEGVEKEAQEWLIESDQESMHDKPGVGQGLANGDNDDDDDDDDLPLSQVKKTVASRPVSLAPGTLPQIETVAEDSSDEELPLAALKEKRARQSMLSFGGSKLDLNFSSPSISPERKDHFEDGASRTTSRMLGQSPTGSLHSNGSWIRSASQTGFPRSPLSREVSSQRLGLGDSDSEDDLPLGQRYAGGADALAAVRTTLEQKEKEAKEAKRLQKKAERAAVRAAARAAKKAEAVADAQESRAGADVELNLNNGEGHNGGDQEDEGDEDDGTESNSDSEDDKPLGYVHPQAAIIAEQAALIRQLQAEKEQQQQHSISPSGSGILPPPMNGFNVGNGVGSSFYNSMNGMEFANARASMMGLPTTQSMMGMGMGAGMNMGMGMGMASTYDGMPSASMGLPVSMSMPSVAMKMAAAGIPGSPGSQLGFGVGGGSAVMGPPMPGPRMSSMGMPVASVGVPMMPTAAPNPMSILLDPKVSSIHNWRTQVPPDATATATTNSAVNSNST